VWSVEPSSAHPLHGESRSNLPGVGSDQELSDRRAVYAADAGKSVNNKSDRSVTLAGDRYEIIRMKAARDGEAARSDASLLPMDGGKSICRRNTAAWTRCRTYVAIESCNDAPTDSNLHGLNNICRLQIVRTTSTA